MSSRPTSLLAVPLLALAAACSSSGGSSAAPPPPPTPIDPVATAPTVELDLVREYVLSASGTGETLGQPAGTARIEFDLEQNPDDVTPVAIEYSTTGGVSWETATVVEDLSGLVAPPGDGSGLPVTTSHSATWRLTDDLPPARYTGAVDPLGAEPIDLRVVVVGGLAGPAAPAPLEVDLVGFAYEGSDLPGPREGQAGLRLDGDHTLLAGGHDGLGPLATSSLLTRGSDFGSFTAAAGDSLAVARTRPMTTLLPDGRLLLAGGADGGGARAEVDSFDPTTELFTPLPAMLRARVDGAAVVTANGRPALLGGDSTGDSWEILDEALGTWTLGSLSQAYEGLLAVTLSDGRILVVGCEPGTDNPRSELLELTGAATLSSSPTGVPATTRRGGTATVLLSGKVLFFGGRTLAGAPSSPTAELFDPVTGSFSSLPTTHPDLVDYEVAARWGHTATLTGSGSVLLAGGRTDLAGTLLADLDRFLPDEGRFYPSGLLPGVRAEHRVDRIADGHLRVSGGRGFDGGPEGPLDSTAALIPTGGEDTAPVASAGSLAYSPFLGLVTVSYVLADAESHPARIRLEWTDRPLDKASWRSMSAKSLGGLPLGDGYANLGTDPLGVSHGFGWDALLDDIFAGGSPKEFFVRLTPIGAVEGATLEFSQILP